MAPTRTDRVDTVAIPIPNEELIVPVAEHEPDIAVATGVGVAEVEVLIAADANGVDTVAVPVADNRMVGRLSVRELNVGIATLPRVIEEEVVVIVREE
ncbi:hypothetical protein EJ997_02720 [Flaviflexus ciconiae]|uniref:Uncharacterized protein n=1 Tax=Flaviflexus ciconiae TaxID=2496867 RepID=A0A3Q9G6P8_9ACTO|nr:hypothetical protein EJ997_02720 [Flaviflexus ciconiae]